MVDSASPAAGGDGPPTATVRVRSATWAADAPALLGVRRAVFVLEQAVPEALEIDGEDPRCHHVLAEAADGTPVGTARLLPDGHLGRMAVLAPWRGRGIGRCLLRVLLAQARADGLRRVVLHAQVHALGFYAREGFSAFGPRFDEAGIDHQAMALSLD